MEPRYCQCAPAAGGETDRQELKLVPFVTAADDHWVDVAGGELTGYATSIIACDAEAGIERRLAPHQTPDGRPGLAVLLFGFSGGAR
jgi:formylmethanofuran:tetrahydromethanopterin formyltransferase